MIINSGRWRKDMGLITNFLAIIIGGILGLTIGKKFKEDIKNIIVDCAGIFIMVIGIKSALVAQKDIMILIYLIIGAVIGQLINIDKRIKDFSQYLEDKFVKEKNSLSNEKSFAKGFSTATILYCVGAMAILGSINSGLTNDNTILNIKAILDGVISIVLTSIYGIGVIFSAFLVFLYPHPYYPTDRKNITWSYVYVHNTNLLYDLLYLTIIESGYHQIIDFLLILNTTH